MKIVTANVKNFRILEDVTISLEDSVTLVVGRNNSGKTSLTEVFFKFLGGERSPFNFEDFSISTYKSFRDAEVAFQAYLATKCVGTDETLIEAQEQAYKALIPKIQLDLLFAYDKAEGLASLSKFIMDLDEARTDAMISCQYSLAEPAKFFAEYLKAEEKAKVGIIEFLKKNHQSFFKIELFAVDAQNVAIRREVSKSEIEDVFLPRFIYAQNQLDDQSTDKSKGLSKGFEDYFKFNNEDNSHVDDIDAALARVSVDLDAKYEGLFSSVFTDLKQFGMGVGVNLQQLKIQSLFEIDKILKGNTQVFYSHGTDLLPEAHNGLGYTKLIFTILRFISFYEELNKRMPRPNFQLIFVEEPEAHLHPQMQYVFIKNITAFIKEKSGWHAQIVITTHSSHIVAESGFECIRYFDNLGATLIVKNLSDFKAKQDTASLDTVQFLQQYMSLNRCDMFFADKVILIEGTVERLLLPAMIKKECSELLLQCISVVEVGGAYAYLFKELLTFLNIQTLVITDIDAVDPSAKYAACTVETPGAHTSNETLKVWLPKKEIVTDLLAASVGERTENRIRLTHQLPEAPGERCGRSFEEAFILNNASLLTSTNKTLSVSQLFAGKTAQTVKTEAYDIARKIKKKTDFAFDIIVLADWETPLYIAEGLKWLNT